MEGREPYFQVPKSLFRLRRTGGISLIAFDIYILMIDRYKLSLDNKANYTDKDGEIFFYYSYDQLSENLNTKRRNSISAGIKELLRLGLIKSRKRFNASTAFYISNIIVSSNEKVTHSSNEKVTHSSNIIVYANKNNINKNKYIKNNVSNNKGKKNVVASAMRNEIKNLIGIRNITVDNIVKLNKPIERLKEVFEFANDNDKFDGWIITCLRDNYDLSKQKKKFVSGAAERLRKLEEEENND